MARHRSQSLDLARLSWGRIDPTRPTRNWDTARCRLRDVLQLPDLRFHDLGHKIITESGGIGGPDHIMESISGRLWRRMPEYYSHIRMEAKREVLERLDARQTI